MGSKIGDITWGEAVLGLAVVDDCKDFGFKRLGSKGRVLGQRTDVICLTF